MTLKKSIWKKIGLIALVVAVMFTFAACDSDNGDELAIKSVESVEDVEVKYGTTSDEIIEEELPAKVKVTLTDDSSETVDVNWKAPEDFKSEPKEDTTYTFDGTFKVSEEDLSGTVEADVTVKAEEPPEDETVTGTLNRIYSGGEEMKIDDKKYDVAAMPGFQEYLNRMSAADHAVLGSEITVVFEDGEIVDLEQIVLEDKDYNERAMTDIIGSNEWYGLTLKGPETGTASVVSGMSAQDVTGYDVTAGMDELTIDGVDFTNANLDVDGNHVTFKNLEVDVDSLDVDGDGFTSEAISEVSGNVNVNGLDAVIDVTGDIVGDVTIDDDADNSTVNATEIDGSLTVNSDSDLDISGVTGVVTLGAQADLDDVKIGEGLEVAANDIVVSDVTSEDGTLTIDADGVTVENSSFAELAADHDTSENATLDTVTFDKMYTDLTGTATELEHEGTLSIDLKGWEFNNVTWPEMGEDEYFDIAINAEEVSLIDSEVSGDLTIGEADAVVDVSEIAENLTVEAEVESVTTDLIGGNLNLDADNFELNDATVEGTLAFVDGGTTTDNAVFNNVTFESEIGFSDLNITDADAAPDAAPVFNGGVIEDNVSALTQPNITFDEVTFEVPEDESAIEITESAFLNDVTFEGDVAVNSSLDLDTGFTGGVVKGDLDFNNDVKVRVVDTELQGNVTLNDADDVRLRSVTVNAEDDVTVGPDEEGTESSALLLRDVTFVDNDNTVNVIGDDSGSSSDMDLTLRGKIEGNEVTTFDKMSSYTFENSPVINDVTQTDLAEVAQEATFNNNTFTALETISEESEEATFNNSTFDADIEGINAEATFDGNTFNEIVLDGTDLDQAATFKGNTFNENVLDDADLTDTATFKNNTFKGVFAYDTTSSIDGNGITAAATFEDNTFEAEVGEITGDATFDGDTFADSTTLQVNSADATLKDIVLEDDGTGVYVNLINAKEAHFVEGLASDINVDEWTDGTDPQPATADTLSFSNLEITDFNADGSAGTIDFVATFDSNTFTNVGPVGAAAEFEGNTFKTDVTTDTEAATFSENTFEGAVTVDVGSSFDGDTIEGNLTSNTTEATFADLEFDLSAEGANGNVNVAINDDTVLNGLTVSDAEAGNDFSVTVDSNKKVTFEGDVVYSDLEGDFILDIKADSADYDNTATWTPEFSNVVIAD